MYNCCDTIQETNIIDLLMNYALFSICKASFTQNRITKNIVIKHLSHLLRSCLDIEKNRICESNAKYMLVAVGGGGVKMLITVTLSTAVWFPCILLLCFRYFCIIFPPDNYTETSDEENSVEQSDQVPQGWLPLYNIYVSVIVFPPRGGMYHDVPCIWLMKRLQIKSITKKIQSF